MLEDREVLLLNTRHDKARAEDYFDRYHIHLICKEGRARFTMNGRQFEIRANEFLIWQLGSEVTDVSYSDDFDADFLCVSKSFLIKHNPERVWATRAFVYIKSHPVIPLDSEGRELCMHDFAEFRLRLSMPGHVFFDEIVGGMLQLFIYDLWQIYAPMLREKEMASSSASDIFRSFLEMVSNHASTERRVTFYADRLCVSAKYLSEISRSCSGRPASEWIAGYAVQEMQRMLKDPDLTLTDISDRMCFPNYPNFAKYAKAALGMSPSEYRLQLEKRSAD